MAKKVHPKDQTEELNRVKIELLKLNPEEWQKLEDLFLENEKKRNEVTTKLATIHGKFDPKLKEKLDFLLSEHFFDKEFKDKIREIEIPRAANAVYPFEQFGIDTAMHVMLYGGDDIFNMSRETLNDKYLDYLCQHAREIFTELTNGKPSSFLLIGVDLRRSKDVIREEMDNLPILRNLKQIRAITTKMPEKRFKWLPIFDELLAVWNLRLEGKSFVDISLMQDISEDLAKKRFYRFFPIVTGTDYTKNTWRDLVKEHLAKIAKTDNPTNHEFWNRVAKTEDVSQKELLPQKPVESSLFTEDKKDITALVEDLKRICSSCPDLTCREVTMKCLDDFNSGDMGAFEDFHPDCPKFYNYLKSPRSALLY